ncbi:MAG: Sir2 family NAD-dependent protein deacetylase [Stellaceae bacterium]
MSPFSQPPAIVVFTGAGLSRSSGFAPFDPRAMPAGVSLEDVVMRDGFERDPERIRGFYNLRRRQLLETIAPNPAHDALTVLGTIKKREVLIVTRNIDDLHERAGSEGVLHTHGELLKARCLICTHVSDRLDDITGATACPVCGNVGHLRPHIVWVGEEPLHIAAIFAALTRCRVFAAIGAAGGSEPARSFLAEADRAGARTIEFAADRAAASGRFAEARHGPLTQTVPEWVRGIL